MYQTLAFLFDTLLFMQTSTGMGLVVVTGASDSFILQRTTRRSLRRWCSFLAAREVAVGASDASGSDRDATTSAFILCEEEGEARDGRSGGRGGVNRGDNRDVNDSDSSDNDSDSDSDDAKQVQTQIRFECYARSSKWESGGFRLLSVETVPLHSSGA